MKRIGLALLCGALFSSPVLAQGDAGFRTALQRGNAADPQLLPFLAQQFKPVAQSLLPQHTVTAVTINRSTGVVLVTATDASGKTVTLDGSKIGGDPGESSAVFGWITCAWNWLTTLGAKKCNSAKAETPMTDVPVNYDRQQERKKNAAYLDMVGG